jgi:DNA repair exonuclease SbcCD ATPase subunit
VFGLASLALGATATGQSSDRERAQLLQLQQQLQRLQADNAALQRERSELQSRAKDAERLKKESAQTSMELARTRAQADAGIQQAAQMRAEMDKLREEQAAQIAQWKKAVEERDTALQAAASEKRRSDAQATLLALRLKVQTGRGDLCEAKHDQAMKFGAELIDLYGRDRLRLCEPITGIWKVKPETDLQALRDRLYEMRLDIPPPAHAQNGAAPGGASPLQ